MSVLEPRLPTGPATLKPKKADRWLSPEEGISFIRRTQKGQRVRSEEFIALVGKAVEQANETHGALAAMFKLRDVLKAIREVPKNDLGLPRHPQPDFVLDKLDDLGERSRAFVEKCAALRAEAERLGPDLERIEEFFQQNPVLLPNRRQLVSKQQLIALYVVRMERRHKLKPQVQPMELETMVQLTAIREGEDLANATGSLQTMSVRWRSILKKVRKGLAADLETAFAVSKRAARNTPISSVSK